MSNLSKLSWVAVLALVACGPRTRPAIDAGEEDAGQPAVDAGRPRGDDPPTGWSVAVPLPPDAGVLTRLGISVAATLDQNGQPLIAAVLDDPNGDGVRTDTRVFFTRWNGVTKAFTDALSLETVGEVDLGHPNRQVAIARDRVTGRIGIVYVKGSTDIRYAFSDDDGANFSLMTVSRGGELLASNPQIAMHAGKTFVAFYADNYLFYRTKDGAAAFTDDQAPLPGGSGFVLPPLSLAVDSAGNPGLAYFVSGVGAMTSSLCFWRPGTATPTVIATSGTTDVMQPERRPSVTLAFAGTNPRVAYHLRAVDPLASLDNTTELFFAAASDATGTTWAAPVAIPRNGNGSAFHSTRWYQGLAVDAANAKVAIAADFTANGFPSPQCGGPKLARSTDGTSFMTCAPLSSPFNFAGDWMNVSQTPAGKLQLVFHYDNRANPSIKPGIILWREQ